MFVVIALAANCNVVIDPATIVDPAILFALNVLVCIELAFKVLAIIALPNIE